MKSKKSENAECGLLLELPVGDIKTSPDNPRIINQKGEDFLELLESIKAMGMIVPVHVRRHPNEKDKYELLAGERRLLAVIKAGQTKIKVINHGTLTDEQAFEITFAENFARTDLTPLEQGKAIEILMIKYKGDTKAVAAKLGRSTSWVLQRKAINDNLISEWKKAIVENTVYQLWTAAHLQLIARFPADIQKDLLEDYEDSFDYMNGTIKVSQLEKELSERLMLLEKAIWDVNDGNLNKRAGSCNKCNLRTSCRPGLFDDLLDEDKIKKNDRCLDRDCWGNKQKAFLQNRQAEERKKHTNLLCISTDSPDYSRRYDLKQTYPGYITNFKSSKEGAKKAVPALVVSGSDVGQVRWVTAFEEKTSSGSRQKIKGQPTPLAERRKMLEAKRDARFLVKLKEIVAKKKVTDLVSKANISNTRLVMALATVFGVDQPYSGLTAYYHNSNEGKKAWDRVFAIADGSTVERLWESVRTILCNNLRYLGPVTQTPKTRIKEALQLAALFELNVKTIYKHIKEEIPEPKSWANLKEDGTPKKKAKKKKANKKAA